MVEFKNILYIGEKIDYVQSGGDAVNLRNYTALKAVFKRGFYHYELMYKNRFSTFFNLLYGNVGVIQQSDFKKIIRYIKDNRITSVFLWSSKLGKLAKLIKTTFPNVRIITFFHNIEIQYYSEEIKLNPSLKNKLLAQVVAKNEKTAVEFSDFLITLNKRDSNLLQKLYVRKSDLELPTSFTDSYNQTIQECVRRYRQNDKLKLLFVGSNFFANVTGMRWFLDNVFFKLDNIELSIVGKGMNEVFQDSKNIRVIGYVTNLDEYYYTTDVVIVPIFHGGGMKTKTAEAMMYGCPILGTSEAFEGYEIETERIGGLADSANEMIDKINRLRDDNFRKNCAFYARKMFEEKYSIDATLQKLSTLQTFRY